MIIENHIKYFEVLIKNTKIAPDKDAFLITLLEVPFRLTIESLFSVYPTSNLVFYPYNKNGKIWMI